MSHFVHTISITHFRRRHTPIDLRVPELNAARGILNGVTIGALLWVAIIALGFAVRAWWLGH